MHARRMIIATLSIALVIATAHCGSSNSTTAADAGPPPCDQTCMDGTALLAFRDAMKLLYNVTLQGKPVGPQDGSSPCPLGGTGHVFGTATSNAIQGATEVQLTYVFDHCAYSQTDDRATQNFSVTVTGTVTEVGTIAVQSSATTSLEIDSDSMTISGTVYAPPINYEADACVLKLGQNGNDLSGMMCGRAAGVVL